MTQREKERGWMIWPSALLYILRGRNIQMVQTLSLLILLIYIDTDIKFTGNAAKPDSSFRPHLDTACDFWSLSTRQTSIN